MTEAGYYISQWHGRPNYHCADCGYATLDMPALVKHRGSAHSTSPPPKPALAESVEADGGPINDHFITDSEKEI